MSLDFEAQQQHFLDAVQLRIVQALTEHNRAQSDSTLLLKAVARHLCLTPNAKRIRPLLTFWFGGALNVDSEKLVDAAAACEFIHSASLLHDDVVDDARMRRGSESANAKWNNSVAVLSGNYVLAMAFELLGNYESQVTRDGIAVVKEMTKAAITEVEVRSKVEATIAAWKEIAMGKTGALFGLCGLIAARVAQDEHAGAQAMRVGKHVGVVFQMNDDIIDITDRSGLKDRYSDIINKEPSLPLIFACEDPVFKDALKTTWEAQAVAPEHASKLGEWLQKTSAIEKTRESMQKEVDAAIDCLGNLAYTQGGKKIVEWLNITK